MGYVKKSPWVIHYDGSSCNGCDIEVLATLCPGFDAERFGVINTGNPKHADIFLVTGSVNEQNASVIKQIYDQMIEPKVVVACGICACSGGIFKDCYNVKGGVDTVIPVDAYVPGCAVRPESLIDAVVAGVEILDKKEAELKAQKKSSKKHRPEQFEKPQQPDQPDQPDQPEQKAVKPETGEQAKRDEPAKVTTVNADKTDKSNDGSKLKEPVKVTKNTDDKSVDAESKSPKVDKREEASNE